MHALGFKMVLSHMDCLSKSELDKNSILLAKLICFEVIINNKNIDNYIQHLDVDYKESISSVVSSIDLGVHAEKFKDLYNDKVQSIIFKFSSHVGFGTNSFENLLQTASFKTLLNPNKSPYLGRLPADVFFHISTFLTGDNIANAFTNQKLKYLENPNNKVFNVNDYSIIDKNQLKIESKACFLLKKVFKNFKKSSAASHVFASIIAFYISSLLLLFGQAQFLWVPLISLLGIFAVASIYKNRAIVKEFVVRNSFFIMNFLVLAPISLIVYFDATYLLFLPIFASLITNFALYNLKHSEVKVEPNFFPRGLDAFFVEKDLVCSESLSSDERFVSGSKTTESLRA